MTIATGIAKKLVIAQQAALGTIAAVNAASAVYLRRVSSNLDLKKDVYQSNEIRSDMQIGDYRHGVRSVDGSIAGELSPGTYQLLMAAMLRKAWVAAPVGGPESDIAAAVTTGNSGTFTSAATGTFLQDGLKVGDVIRWTGWTTTGAGNNSRNFLITALTDLVMTGTMLDGSPVVAKIAGDAVTATGVGKKIWTPTTGHTNLYFTVEHNYSDLDLSEVFTDCKPATMAFKLPATGMGTIDIGMMGLNMTGYAGAAAPYFTGPAAAETAGVVAAVNGAVYVQGAAVALITGMDFDVAGGQSAEPVVGSNYKPDIFDGRVQVKGNMTVFFQDVTFRDYFINETEVRIVAAFTCSNAATADFLAFTMPRVKVGGASKDDGEKGLVMTMPFQALFDTSAGADTGATATASLATTLSVQDSTL